MNGYPKDPIATLDEWILPLMSGDEIRSALNECDPAIRPALLRRLDELEGRS